MKAWQLISFEGASIADKLAQKTIEVRKFSNKIQNGIVICFGIAIDIKLNFDLKRKLKNFCINFESSCIPLPKLEMFQFLIQKPLSIRSFLIITFKIKRFEDGILFI